MSLTSFLRQKDVGVRFRQEFQAPKFSVQKPLLAPPLGGRRTLIGTAFDYLLRFYIEHLNPQAIARPWIAEEPIRTVSVPAHGDEMPLDDIEGSKHAIVEQAREDHSEYLSSGKITEDLLRSCLLLAQVDPILRAGFVDRNMGKIWQEDVTDLRNLISIVDPELFKARKLCLLNPSFGKGSTLVGGADVDLVIDETMIEIKTVQKLRLVTDDLNQLLGYCLLHEIGGVGELKPKPAITRVAIYFSRHAYLHVMELDELVQRQSLPSFLDWFKGRAARQFRSGASGLSRGGQEKPSKRRSLTPRVNVAG